MSGTPTFQITNAGLQAAAIATPTGPFIDIVAFQVGSAYGYTPQQTDLSIDGSLLFSGTPSSYQNVANATIDILCEIPPNAGPFQFGEIALMLPGNVLFAKAVFALPQNKFSALGTNVVSSYELHCLLTLAQGTAIFQISTLNGPPAILQIFDWSSIYPPSISAYPDVPLLQVVEPSEYGDATLLSNASGSKWTIDGTYARYDQTNDTPFFSIANASSTWIEVPAASLHPLDLTNVNERFVIETPDGYFRSVNSVVTSGANYRFNLNSKPLQTVPALGSNLLIYRDDQAQGSSYYSQILDPLYYDSAQLSQNTGSANVYAATYKQKNPVPYEGMIRSLDVGVAVNTGASTFAVDGGTPYPIVGQANAPLQGGEINGAVTLRFTGANNHWIIQNSAYGTLQIPNAQQTLQAVNFGQTNGLISTAIAPFPAEIATLQGEVNNLNSEVGTINGEIVGINNTIVGINGEIGTINGEIAGIDYTLNVTVANNLAFEVTTLTNEIYNIDIGYGYAPLGNFTGTFTDVNNSARVAYYAVSGGNWQGGGSDNRENTVNLVAYVNGVQIGQADDNNNSDAKSAFLLIPVANGQTIQVTSNPYSAPAPGTFSVTKFLH